MKKTQYKIYLDVCSLNRPYDDQSQARIRLESEAVIMILNQCQTNEWQLIDSNALDVEIAQTPNQEKREQVKELLSISQIKVIINDSVKKRILQLTSLGFSPYDAAHIASAEEAKTDVLITTDDRLLKKAYRYANSLQVKLANPIQWITQVNKLEQEDNDTD